MADLWSIETEGLTGTLAEVGITGLTRERMSQSPDVCHMTRDGQPFDADALPYGQAVSIMRDEIPWMYGTVHRISRSGSGDAESISYIVHGPWDWLDRTVFQQDWRVPINASDPDSLLQLQERGRVILGLGLDGASVNTMQQVESVLDFAIDNGAPFQIGDLPSGIAVPHEEMTNPTCSEVIRKMLRWHPDVSTWFDYSTTPPTLHFVKRSAAAAQSLQIGDNVVASQLQDRPDLVPPAVVIQFERTNSTNSVTWSTVETQTAGSGGAKQPGAVVLTIELFGSEQQTQVQRVRAESLQPSSATWWRKRVPALSDIPASQIDVLDSSVAAAESDEFDYPDGTPAREIVEGAAPPWLADAAWPVIVRARLRITADGEDVDEDDDGEDYVVRCTGTTLQNKTYERLVSWLDAESTPVGLAQSIYDALQIVHWEGSVTVTDFEIPDDGLHPGKVLNLTGGRAAWQTMKAQIQRVSEDVDAGQTVITIGPPEHLSPQDLVELLRVNRTRHPSRMISTRDTGQAHSGGRADGPTSAANQDSGSRTGGKWRIHSYCANGVIASRYFLTRDVPG